MYFKTLVTLGSLIILMLLPNIQIEAQCTSDAHSSNPSDSWVSCQTLMSPNSARGLSHWLMYDLGNVYEMGPSTYWNYNVAAELNKGFKNIAIDYSLDGITWIEAGTFQLPKADGTSSYSGFEGPDLTGISAKYILVTGLNTWGNGACAGLSEVKFQVMPSSCGTFSVTGLYPVNPILNGIYFSSDEIISNGTVDEIIDVIFKAPNSVTLQSDFNVEAGSAFSVVIVECN